MYAYLFIGYEINNDNIINTSRRQLKTTASVSLTENLRPTLKLQDINIDYEKNNSSSSSCELLEHNVLAREDSNDSKCSSAYNQSKNDRIAKKLNATRNKKKLVKNKSNDSVNDSMRKKSRYEVNNDNIIDTCRRQFQTASVIITESLRPTLKLQDINIDYEKNNSSSSSSKLVEYNVLAPEYSKDTKCSSADNQSSTIMIYFISI
ncbi:Hypothetical protein CINCED_3A020139 [Cinara cedri]|uniref:Uncharacterized protein n=1 Tax=Cinara cedri TaxID=506608 RepID=A0A5E4M5S2_9HEMI|nr:Hypothetical protein CINCED_3A020139 [Cinara cedri]